MSTTRVSTEELEGMAHRVGALAHGFASARPPALQSCGNAGRAVVEQSTEAFARRFGVYLDACRAEVHRMGHLAELAAEAYQRQDGLVASRAAQASVTKVGGR